MQTYDIQINKNKKEITQHGSFEFPLIIYTTQISKNILGFIDWHWHNELQLCYITHGSVQFSVNQKTFILNEKEGIFINTKQLHQAVNYQNIDSSYICLDFHSQFISSFQGSLINSRFIDPYLNNSSLEYCIFKNNKNWQKMILELLQEIYVYYNESNHELDILINLLRIWNLMVSNYFKDYKNELESYHQLRVRVIMDYINNHYAESIQLDEIANIVGLSKSICCKEFKKVMGYTIFNYLMNYRLIMATKLLLQTDESITEIAYKTGFSNSSYFIKNFKLKTGKSPSSYRKEHKSSKQDILTSL